VVTVTALAGIAVMVLVSGHVSASAQGALGSADRPLVLGLVAPLIDPADLTDGGDTTRASELEGDLEALERQIGLGGIRVFSAAGQPLYATERAGTDMPPHDRLARAVLGQSSVAVQPTAMPEGSDPASHVSELIPLLDGSRVVGIVELRRDASFLAPFLFAAQRDLVLAALALALVLVPLLLLIYRTAQRRIHLQSGLLANRWRLDPLTRLISHGASVELLTDAVQSARRGTDSVAVALIDIDNFRQLNEIHGHDAGDRALRTMGQLLVTSLPSTCSVGRYGPDEFIVIAKPTTTGELATAFASIRDRLRGMSFPGRSREQLPISVSVGIAEYPVNADSAPQVLSEAAMALADAKSSGGDDVRLAQAPAEGQPPARYSSFEILRGLVNAVDTKDRYTRRHSEDVSRYAHFLGTQLGLDEPVLRAIRLSGLLHDIGKIGIPDEILRKPGPLTAQEQEIVRQHVLLGDLIVRDVPNLMIVRAGVRHHHERWDGQGYLQGLAGDRIPLIARVLAVADAFSAMTTTRPYRKALPVREALRRIEDAAGSQFEPALATAFVRGMETAKDAPQPGDQQHPQRLWVPATNTA
jgi:diguanylate cyclase (GGDEF)-like protein